MKDNEFDDIIKSKLSDYASKSDISEEAMWSTISKGGSYKSSFLNLIIKPWVYIPSILVIIGSIVFFSFNKNSQKIQSQESKQIICTDSITENHEGAINQTDSVKPICKEEKSELKNEKKNIPICNKIDKQKIEISKPLPVEAIGNQNNKVIEQQSALPKTIEQKVEQQIVKKEVQITDTVVKTKRIRKK